jgi:excisionase family DNA binding protein
MAEVAQMLGFGLSETRMLVIQGDIRPVKHGRHRRVLPEWMPAAAAGRRLDRGVVEP